VLTVREVQTVVYRDAPPAASAAVPPPPGPQAFDPLPWTAHRMVRPDETLLFRYSALTFNSHRIHYDRPYATGVEGYRGLVVHGPLTASLLLDLAQAELGDNALKGFAFRGVSPAICGDPLHLVLRGAGEAIELAAFAADGRQVMAASGSA
jgi:3-methylfumaryl-CoA hydratase